MAKRTSRAAARQETPKMIRVTQVRSPIGFHRSQAEALRSLGLRRIRHSVERQDTPSIRGLILKVRHLVEVDERR